MQGVYPPRDYPNEEYPYNPYFDLNTPPGRQAFKGLILAEQDCMVAEAYANDEEAKERRRHAVEFIENQSRSRNFDAMIPYMAMTYYDRFISRGDIPPVVTPYGANFSLCLICCLTIAWKLRTKTFELLTFLNERNLEFSAKHVLDMELCICLRLEWRIRPLTPFRFLDFLIQILGLEPPEPSPRSAVNQLIVKSQFDIAFTKYRPSVVAAAAVLTVVPKMLPQYQVIFKFRILNLEFFEPLKEVVLKCQRDLTPLYRDASIPVARDTTIRIDESAERRAEIKKSEPIAIPGQTLTSPLARIQVRRMETDMWKAILEEAMILRGENTGEIRPAPEEGHELVQADADEPMNFELGWTEARAAAETKNVAPGGYVNYLMQMLTDCCSGLMQRCNIL